MPFNIEPNENQTIAKFTLVHTLPSFNAKGRAVTYRTQRNSISSVKFNPVSLEHQMVSNHNFSSEDTILGVMLGATIESLPDNPVIPSKPIATEVWAVLWNRVEDAQKIVEDVETGFRSWKASYEINERSEDEILVDNRFIPISEASEEILQKIGPESTGSINGERVLLVLGGRDGFIDYWGAGLTLSPADPLSHEVEVETASLAKKQIVCLAFAKPSKTTETPETATIPNQKTKNGGEVEMTKEEKEKLEAALKQQLASLSPTLQSVIDGSGLDVSKAKQLVESIKAENEAKVAEIASTIEKKYTEGYVFKADLEAAEKTAYDKAVQEELPKARKSWEAEIASIQKREEAITEAKLPLTDARKEKIRAFPFDESGDKEFASYLDELKEVASLKPQEKDKKSKQTETASIGSLLNTNDSEQSGTESGQKTKSLSALFK